MKIDTRLLYFDLATLIFAMLITYSFVQFVHLSQDLEWYLNPERQAQFGYVNISKSRVSFLVDFGATFQQRLLIACFMTSVSQLVFLSALRRHVTFVSSKDFTFILALLLFSANIYLTQISMHLWRQLLAVYFMMAAVLSDGRRAAFLGLLSAFFHEVTIPLLVGHWLSQWLFGMRFKLFGLRAAALMLAVLVTWHYAIVFLFSLFRAETRIWSRFANLLFVCCGVALIANFIAPAPVHSTVMERLTIIVFNVAIICCLSLMTDRHPFFKSARGLSAIGGFVAFGLYGILSYV